jgi:hypothetical protein
MVNQKIDLVVSVVEDDEQIIHTGPSFKQWQQNKWQIISH